MRDDREDNRSDRMEGRNAVREALLSGREINKLWVLNPKDGKRVDKTLNEILTLAKERKIVVVRCDRRLLDSMSSTGNHQGVIAAVASHEYKDVDEIVDEALAKGHAPLLVALDEIKDSYNLASVLRISDAAGVDGIIIPKHRSVALDAVVSKLSAGAVEYVPVARVTNLSTTLEDLKKRNFWVCGTDMEGAVDYDKADLKGPLVIVIGSEGEGMRDKVSKACDFKVKIPMQGHVNSLNAAVACGIVVFEAARQRKEQL